MAYSNVLAPSGITAQLVRRPGHWYWDNQLLTADRILWSWVNRLEPASFGGNQQAIAAGATGIDIDTIFNVAEANNAAYHAHLGQTPAGNISVAMPTAAEIIAATGQVAGEYFEFSYTNLSTDIITITSSAGGLSEVGIMTIAASTTAKFRVYISVATSGVEAGSLIRL